MSAMSGDRGLIFQFATTMRECQVIGMFIQAIHCLKPFPDRVALLIPIEFVTIHQAPGRNPCHDHPWQEPAVCGSKQVSSRFPSAAARVLKRLFNIVWQGKTSFRLRSPEIEGNDGSKPVVEGSSYGSRVTSPCNRTEKNQPLGINPFLFQQQIGTTHDIPRHPPRQTFTDQLKLESTVVTEVIVLATDTVRLRVVSRRLERMLPPFAMSDLIEYQDIAPGASPGHTHVLQFTVWLGSMMSMTDHNTRHRFSHRFGNIQIGRNPPAGS